MIVSILLYQDIGTETQVELDDPSDNSGQREGHYRKGENKRDGLGL